MLKIFCTYICWIIYKTQHLEVSGAVRHIYMYVVRQLMVNFLEPSGPLQGCNGTAVPFFSFSFITAHMKGIQHWQRNWGFKLQQKQEIFLVSKISRPALGPTHPPIQWVPGRGLKLSTHLHLVPGLRMNGAITLLPHMLSWCGQALYFFFFLIHHLFFNSSPWRNSGCPYTKFCFPSKTAQ